MKKITHWAPITISPLSSRWTGGGQTTKKINFGKRHRRSSPTTTTSGLPGPNNPFGGPNAAAVRRDVDKRKESGEREICVWGQAVTGFSATTALVV